MIERRRAAWHDTGLMPAQRAGAGTAAAARGDREAIGALQDALLPLGLPVLPGLQLAARYLPAGAGPTAGGDWYDAIPRPGGTVALVVGDVVGRGAPATAVMARLRAVLTDRLGSGESLGAAMAAADRFADSTAGAAATTVCTAVLDPRSGRLVYCTAGHPPPLVVGSDGQGIFLPASGAGPLATGSTFGIAEVELALHDMVLLYSDGIVNRPERTPMQSAAELARTVGDALANRAQPDGAPPEATQRVCQQTSELLTRDTGYVDDIVLVAAQRVPEVGPLRIELPAEVATVHRVRPDLAIWLLTTGADADDVVAIQHAVGELVTNAVEHAPRQARPCCIVLHGVLDPAGVVHIEVSDDGQWREPDMSVPFRGNGLAMAGLLSDDLHVRPGRDGTSVTVRRRLVRAVTPYPWRFDQLREPAQRAGLDVTLVTASQLRVRGAVDLNGAAVLRDHLLRHTRAGTVGMTVDLSAVTLLSSAAVQVLHEAVRRATTQATPLRLRAPAGTVAQHVLAMVALPHDAGAR